MEIQLSQSRRFNRVKYGGLAFPVHSKANETVDLVQILEKSNDLFIVNTINLHRDNTKDRLGMNISKPMSDIIRISLLKPFRFKDQCADFDSDGSGKLVPERTVVKDPLEDTRESGIERAHEIAELRSVVSFNCLHQRGVELKNIFENHTTQSRAGSRKGPEIVIFEVFHDMIHDVLGKSIEFHHEFVRDGQKIDWVKRRRVGRSLTGKVWSCVFSRSAARNLVALLTGRD